MGSINGLFKDCRYIWFLIWYNKKGNLQNCISQSYSKALRKDFVRVSLTC